MKKMFASLLAVVFLVAFSCSAFAGGDVRNCKWGDTVEQVKKAEKKQKSQLMTSKDEKLDYVTSIFGCDCVVSYLFDNNKLVRVSYFFMSEYESQRKRIMSNIEKQIASSYEKDQNPFKEGKSKLEKYLSSLMTNYHNDRTHILMMKDMNPEKCRLSVTYTEIQFKKREEEREAQELNREKEKFERQEKEEASQF